MNPSAATGHGIGSGGRPALLGWLTGQVLGHCLKVAVGTSREHGFESLLELLGEQPPFGAGVTQAIGDPLTIGIRCSHDRPSGHI